LVGRVGRRRGAGGVTTITPGAGTPSTRLVGTTDLTWRQADLPTARLGYGARGADAVAPVSPAMPPRTDYALDGDSGNLAIPLLPGERTLSRRVKFAVANGCTVGSLLLGMAAAFLAINGELRLAAIAILACVVLDGCDGGLARKFGVASPFGAQMDSLADLSSFGVATGIVVYSWLTASGASQVAAGAVSGLIVVCAAIRLARFNVSPKNGRFFCGVPTTMTAAVLALATQLSPPMPAWALVAAVAMFALAMVSSFPYAKLAKVIKLPPWLLVLPVIAVLVDVKLAFVVVVLGYLVSGPLLALRQRSA
jgi:CDP-diacylglycerol--serine O-phosphatidyltransferase